MKKRKDLGMLITACAVLLLLPIFIVAAAGPEAGMLLSLAGDLRICQCVDPNKTCRMELPLSILEKLGYQFP